MMEHIVEPYRLSLLDVLKKNLKAAKRNTYLHRVIYVTQHSFPNYRMTDDLYQKCVNKIQEKYMDEKITGLLLFYPEYFCHVMESSEQSLHHLLIEICTNDEIQRYVHKRKLLAVYHNINQRLLEEWMLYSDKPPTLLEKIEIDVDLETATRYIYNCIKKLYGLLMKLRPVQVDGSSATTFDADMKSPSVSFQNPARLRLTDYLPEYSLLDFLLRTEYTEDLKVYVAKYGHVPDAESYQTMVWPPWPSYVPFNVFDVFQDPIQDLPSREHIKLKEVEVPEVKKKDTDQ